MLCLSLQYLLHFWEEEKNANRHNTGPVRKSKDFGDWVNPRPRNAELHE